MVLAGDVALAGSQLLEVSLGVSRAYVIWRELTSRDGMLCARLPYLSLTVRAPAARARSWCPRQIPMMGTADSCMRRARLYTVSWQWVGSPGPLEMKTPSKLSATLWIG